MLKRAHTRTFHRLSSKHLHRYVNEFCGRHNIRDLDTIRHALVVLAVLLAMPTAGPVQERPAVANVLQRFADREDFEAVYRARNDAGNLLRQVDGPMTEEEIRALIEGLAEIALSPNAHSACAHMTCPSARYAGSVLRFAVWRPGVYVPELEGPGLRILTADDIRGRPVPEAFDALVRIYETLAERALAEGGDDPFLEAARRDDANRTPDGYANRYEHMRLFGSLGNVLDADLAPDGRGWAYVLALFERSKPPCRERDGPPNPPDCATGRLGSAWCVAGKLLHENTLGGDRPWPAPDRPMWERRCSALSSPWTKSPRHSSGDASRLDRFARLLTM